MSSRWTAGCGVLLIGAGFLLFLSSAGLLSVNLVGLVFPLFLIAIGAITIWVAANRGSEIAESSFAIPLDSAGDGWVKLRYGAGRLIVKGGAAPGNLVEVETRGGAQSTTETIGTTRMVEIRPTNEFVAEALTPWRWAGGDPPQWTVRLASGIPIRLDIQAGACESRIDLADTIIPFFELMTGASSTRVTTPAKGATEGRIRAGAAEVRVRAPEGVAGRIRAQTGLGEVHVDRSRFPVSPGGYETPGFSAAADRLDLSVEVGAASVYVE